jgi:hypothetical protein
MTGKPETRYFAEFMGAAGKVRYVGHGAQMPFDKGQAFPFETRAAAKAALDKIHKAHRSGSYERIAARRVIVSKPSFMLALGL